MIKKEIFFHVGLGKTASTFLQYKVFPKFNDLYYIQRTKFKKSINIINNSGHHKYLISNEFDLQFERETAKFSKHFPNTKIIIVLRRHDSWIASQYRRLVKNGMSITFEDFIDIENDLGFWKQKDLLFYPKLQFIIERYSEKPLVLFYEDLKNNPLAFVDKIADFINVSYNPKNISFSRKHISYNEKQLKIRRFLNKYFHGQISESKNPLFKFLQRLFIIYPSRYIILYLALLVPSSYVPNEPLISKEYLKKIRDYFSDDWNKCKEFAKR